MSDPGPHSVMQGRSPVPDLLPDGGPDSSSRLLNARLEQLSQALAAQIRPDVGLWDPEAEQPTPTDHYGQLASALALSLLDAGEQARTAEQVWRALTPKQRGHAPFNRFLLLLLNQRDGDQRPLHHCPLEHAYPSNNWALLAQLCRLLEAQAPAQQRRADARLRRMLLRWMTECGGFIDYPATPSHSRSGGSGRIATPMAYHHKALFVAIMAAWQTGDQRWAPILTRLLDWTLLSWDGAGGVGGFGRSNHALFGEACLLAALLLIGAGQPEHREWAHARMLTGVLRRWQQQERADGLLWLTPADAAVHSRAGWDEYMHLSVYNAWTAAILAWARHLSETAERPAVLRDLSLPTGPQGLSADPSAGLLRVESDAGHCALLSTRGQPPQAFRQQEIDCRYSGGLLFHLRAGERYLVPPPVRLAVNALMEQPALAGWVPVFACRDGLYGLTDFDAIEVQWLQARLSITAVAQPLALTRQPVRGLFGRGLAALDWRLLGGRLGRRQALQRPTLREVSGQLRLQLDLNRLTLSYQLALDNSAEAIRYINPAGHALIAETLPERWQVTGPDQTAVDKVWMRSAPLPATVATGQGYCLPSVTLPMGRSTYGIELRWS